MSAVILCVRVACTWISFVQKHLFQADYFRDPTKVGGDKYETYSQLAQWNNEGSSVDDTIKVHHPTPLPSCFY